MDPISQATKREIVDFLPFVEGIRHRSRILTGFTVKTSAAYQKIEMMDEQQILDLWEETPGEIKTLFLHTLCQENAERTGKDRTASPEDWLKCFEKLGWYAAKKENSVTEEETADEGQ